MADKQQRYLEHLESWSKERWGPGFLRSAICYTQLKDYPKAKQYYVRAVQDFIRKPRGWEGESSPDFLVESYVLAGQPRGYAQIAQPLEAYKLDYRGDSLAALHSYVLLYLLSGRDQEAGHYAAELLKKQRHKWGVARGKTAQAIIAHDQAAFDAALQELLLVHRGEAKFGGLREVTEGFLSLAAMALAKVALDRGLLVNAESEYFSRGYLDYLTHSTGSRPDLVTRLRTAIGGAMRGKRN